MENKENIARLIDVAKRRIGSIDINGLNSIIDPNKDNMLKKNTRELNYKKEKIVRSIGASRSTLPDKGRLNEKFFTKVNGNFHSIYMPEEGSFNAGIVRYNKEKLICVYRPDEYNFIGCYLDNNYNVIKGSYYKFKINNCADPRVLWNSKNQLILIYSSVDKSEFSKEHICGTVMIEDKESGVFVDRPAFRISPINLEGRQKNWMPFTYNNKIHLIAHVNPHVIYELNDNNVCKKLYETKWKSPWMIKESLRGSTNAIRLDDGNYLSTFHTSMNHRGKLYYDNGCYIFSGKPPFNVLKCANRTYLPAEAACEKHFRKANDIVCNFPVGMIVEDNKVIISYGDNDTLVKIVEYKLEDLIKTMVDIY